MENSAKSGLIINDISDHLPVFIAYDWQLKKKKEETRSRYVRVRTTEAKDKFRSDLLKEEWRGVYVEDVNAAYESFLKIYISLYDKHCPTVLRTYKGTYYKKPWITKGLLAKRKITFIKTSSNLGQRQLKSNTRHIKIS